LGETLSNVNGNGVEGGGERGCFACEDLAFNIPRRFEAFWPQSKVTAVRTGSARPSGESNNVSESLSPKCFVNGDGCTTAENPNLHSPTCTRVAFDFEGPTRNNGRLSQSTDVTMVSSVAVAVDSYPISPVMDGAGKNTRTSNDVYDTEFVASRQFSQYNINQELQLFYKEIVFLTRPVSADTSSLQQSTGKLLGSTRPVDGKTIVNGSVRVAAFLPEDDTNDREAIALYNYRIKLQQIDEEDVGSF